MERRTEKGERIVWLAGMPLELHYSINSMCAMEARAGLPLDRLMDRHFSATRLLLWAGLHQTYPELTVWDAGELIGEHILRGGRLEDVVEACADGLRAAGIVGGDDPDAPDGEEK